MNEKELSDISVYTLKLIDQTISVEEFEHLNVLISSNAEAARHYNMLMIAVNNFQENGKEITSKSSVVSSDLWKELAEYEKSAPAVEIEESPAEETRELIQKVVYPISQKRKISKFNIFMLFNAAAVILFLLYLRFVPPQTGIEVATLTDSLNAKWADNSESMQKGGHFYTGKDTYMLREGVIKLTFDNQAVAVIEAPAEFQIIADDRIGLQYGRIFSSVPPEAIGFSVYTPSAKIVDMGTEFGVKADIDGDTELHVFKGKTMLVAGKNAHSRSVSVTQGVAMEVSGDMQTIKDITCKETAFINDFKSQERIIQRGHQQIDLQLDKSYQRWLAYSKQLQQDPDLVLYYPFMKADASKQYVVNYAENMNSTLNAAFGGTFGVSTFTEPGWTTGRWPNKSALKFDRSKRTCISVPENPDFSLRGNITLAAWIRCPDTQKGGHLFSNRVGENVNYQFGCFAKEDPYYTGIFQFLRTNDTTTGFGSSKTIPWTSDWTFVAVTHDGKTVRFYLNGELFEAIDFVCDQSPITTNLLIGDIPSRDGMDYGYAAFNGLIDEMMIFKRVLSPEEIKTAYLSGKP